jgi:hypothetical protein
MLNAKVSHCSFTFCMINKVCIIFIHVYIRSHTACFDRIHSTWQATTLFDPLLSIISASLLNTEAICLTLVTMTINHDNCAIITKNNMQNLKK